MDSTRAHAVKRVIVIASMMALAGCETQEVSGDQKTFIAQNYCLSGQANEIFASRQEACEHYQTHFKHSTVGNPGDFFEYLSAAKNLCELNNTRCLKYWDAVSEDSAMIKLYPGINVRDPRIWAAKRAAVKACTDDSHPVTPDGHDVKPEVCLQAARLLRGDHVAPDLLRKVEHKACDLGDADECHYATMDGEVVDIKASEARQAAHQLQISSPQGDRGAYGADKAQ